MVFEPLEMGPLTLKNRFVRSATYTGTAEPGGAPTDRTVELYRELARGGLGLIVTGHAFISEEGSAGPGQLGAHRDELIPALTKLVQAVHTENVPVLMQLSHGGVYSRDKNFPEVGDLSGSDIRGLIEAFAAAATRAQKAGFDGVQLHAGHGYLMSQFLSPLFNVRKDEWGGSVENRVSMVRETVELVRKEQGPGFTISIKLNGSDHEEGGLTAETAAHNAAVLAASGADSIEVSGGLLTSRKGPVRRSGPEACFEPEARVVRERAGVPVMLVGGIRSLEKARAVLNSGGADLVSMSRPFIREPDLVAKLQQGASNSSACVNDSRCLRAALSGDVYCVDLARSGTNGGSR